MIAILDLCSLLIYPAIAKKKFSRKDIQGKLAVRSSLENLETPVLAEFQRNHILHPYLGFVANPSANPLDQELSRNNNMVISEEGFPSESPLVKKDENSVTICILGGSFAMNFYLDSKETLETELKSIPRFKNKDIKIVSMAMAGYKQPQQLLALNYFLSLGGEYDVIINIDGFNELALTVENLYSNVYQFFPRLWNVYSSKALNSESILRFANLTKTKQKQNDIKKIFSTTPLLYSNFSLILWELLDTKLESQIRIQNKKLAEMISNEGQKSELRDYQKSGPSLPEFQGPFDFLTRMANYWEKCSMQINDLGKTNNFDYFHFLQPNQYVENSKTFTKSEKETAYSDSDDYIYKLAVEDGYPILVANGKELSEKNVNFTDLTMIYKQIKEAVYEDTCCHVDKYGNDIVAKKIPQGSVHLAV